MVNIARGIDGTLAMARGLPDWRERLPSSQAAMFGSFWSMALAAPAILLLTEVTRQSLVATPEAAELVPTLDRMSLLTSNLFAAVLSWMGSLFVLIALAERSGTPSGVRALVAGYNWSRLIINVAGGLSAALMVATGALPMLPVIALALLVLTVWLDFGVVRQGLGLTTTRAVGALAFVMVARVVANLVVTVIGRLFAG